MSRWDLGRWISLPATLLVAALISPAALGQIEVYPRASSNQEVEATVQLLTGELAKAADLSAIDIRVTVGVAAFREALGSDDSRPIVAAFLTSTEFDASRAALSSSAVPLTAVFSNPDPIDQLSLARALLGGARIGVFDSQAAHPLVQRLERFNVRSIPVLATQDLESVLRAADVVDAIIVLPDPAVLNRSNINHVVRTLYQRRKVLIGYSATLVRAGSLGSVYADPTASARSVRALLEQYRQQGELPAPRFVRDVEFATNAPLARSLNLVLPPESDIRESIRARQTEGPQ